MAAILLTLYRFLCHTVRQLTPNLRRGGIQLAFDRPIDGVETAAAPAVRAVAPPATPVRLPSRTSTDVHPPASPPDRGMYFILRLTQLIVRPDSRLGVLRYKIAPKCLLSGPSGHSGVGGNPGVAGTVRSYNLVYTYPCQPPPPRLSPCCNPTATSGAGLKGLFHPAYRVRYGCPRAGFLHSVLRRNALSRSQPIPFPAGGAVRLRLGSPAPPALTGGSPAMPDKNRCRGNSGHRPAAAHHDTRRIHDPHQ